jgi:hypothetical protein
VQRIAIPDIGDFVSLFLLLEGDDQYTGPFEAVVVQLDLVSQPYPVLSLTYGPDLCWSIDHVPYRAGPRSYWLPLTTTSGVQA